MPIPPFSSLFLLFTSFPPLETESHTLGWPPTHLLAEDDLELIISQARSSTNGFYEVLGIKLKVSDVHAGKNALPAEIHGLLTCGFPRNAFWCRELYGIREMAWPLKRLRFTTIEIVIVCMARNLCSWHTAKSCCHCPGDTYYFLVQKQRGRESQRSQVSFGMLN